MALKDLPADAQPREKLLARGPAALADAELLAILLRTGIVGKGVLQMAQELLDPPGIDPDTGHHYDDTRRYVDAAALSPEERTKLFDTNARRVFPRLGHVLEGAR